MGEIDLLFRARLVDGHSPVELVFGGSEPGQQVAKLQAAGRITGLGAALAIRAQVCASASGRISGLRGKVGASVHINVARPAVGQMPGIYGHADGVCAAANAAFGQATPVLSAAQVRGTHGKSRQSLFLQSWQEGRRVAQMERLRWKAGQSVMSGQLMSWQEALRLRRASGIEGEQATIAAGVTQQLFEEALRRRHAMTKAFGSGLTAAMSVHTDLRSARALHKAQLARYEDARRPWPGATLAQPGPPNALPCYALASGTSVEMVFEHPRESDVQLIFSCCKSSPGPLPPRYQIPIQSIYMTIHTLEAELLPGLEPVVLSDVIIASDDDGFGWSFSANGPEHLLDQLAPVGGLPARLRIVVDGIDFVFVVQTLSRKRSFGNHRVAVQGVSMTALLSNPYMPEQTWLNTAPVTAQQLVREALEFTGVELDWKVSDWLVPAGAWSHRGTPLSAVMRVAASIGAVVSSHRTRERLIVAPRFPHLPWKWADATPDVRIPADVIVTDELRPEPRAAYNAVYISGQVGGILGHVRRAGSAGGSLAPQITDALIAEAVAARQRGEAVLGASGNKLVQSITMPVLSGGTAPGLILPGQLIEVVDTRETWRGLVRASRLNAAMPVVRQQITVVRAAL